MIKCDQCKFFKSTPLAGAGSQAGQCHFEPPKVFPIPAHNGISFATTYPTVQGNEEGCSKGDVKLAKNDIN